MPKTKSALLDKKIAKFAESSVELLTNIHARNKGGTRAAAEQKKRIQKSISIPDPDMDLLDEEPFGL